MTFGVLLIALVAQTGRTFTSSVGVAIGLAFVVAFVFYSIRAEVAHTMLPLSDMCLFPPVCRVRIPPEIR